MPRAYSGDMRQRVIAEVESGASRRAAEEEFEIRASTAIIWVKCFLETDRCAAKPRGGSISPLEKHAEFLLGLIERQPDLTLDEVVLAMRKHKIPEMGIDKRPANVVVRIGTGYRRIRDSCAKGAIHFVHYGTARSANSVTTVRANQLPRVVSRAYALPWSTLSVSMPSRPRSATVAPEMGLSPTLADGAVQTPHRL